MKKVFFILAVLAVVGCSYKAEYISPEPFQSVNWDATWEYLNYISPEQYQSCYQSQNQK